MDLAEQYARQRPWRSWERALDALPPLAGARVLDLGCGVGDRAAALARRGARVVAVDANEALLDAARAHVPAGVELVAGDLRALPELGAPFDGLWCSFAAAYLPELPAVLARWRALLRPGGRVALVEVDDLFGHEPLGARTRELLDGYARGALSAGRYDFHMGRKLAGHLRAAGFEVEREEALPDAELAFDGAAAPEVHAAWAARLERMTLLHEHCGAELGAVREDLLACLASPAHRARARVVLCLARGGGAA